MTKKIMDSGGRAAAGGGQSNFGRSSKKPIHFISGNDNPS